MPVPELIRDASRALLAIILAHQYFLLFFIVAIEEAGVPLPAPTDVVIAFYGHRAGGDFAELAQVVLICAFASTAGTLVPYALARRFGHAVVHRVGPLFDVRPEAVERWTDRVHRHGFIAVVIARLIPGARVVSSLVAGTAEVPVAQFSTAVFLAGLVYWTFWVAIGAIFGAAVEHLIGPAYIRYVVLAVPVVFVAFLAFRFARARARSAAHQR
jgi:membrane protein DedA with SNARE-associated domain